MNDFAGSLVCLLISTIQETSAGRGGRSVNSLLGLCARGEWSSTALAARGAVVRIGSGWTNVLAGSSMYEVAPYGTATRTAPLRSVGVGISSRTVGHRS